MTVLVDLARLMHLPHLAHLVHAAVQAPDAAPRSWSGASLWSLHASSVETRAFVDTVPSTLAPPRPVRGPDIDFGEAMRGHFALTRRLEETLAGRPRCRLDVDLLRRCDCSRLGRWLHGRGKASYGDLTLYHRLLVAHRLLHQAAADVLQLHLDGRTDAARLLFERGLYVRYNDQVRDLLTQFYLDRTGRVPRPTTGEPGTLMAAEPQGARTPS